MTNLATFPWTDGDDIVLVPFSSAYLDANQTANAGNGNDAVIGIGLIPGLGVSVLTDNEDVFLLGAYVGPSGVYLAEGAVLNMGNGNDFIGGTGANGINGPLVDVVPGSGVFNVPFPGANGGDGIRNRGTIITGNGSDLTVGFNSNLGPFIRGKGGDGASAVESSGTLGANDGRAGGNGGAGIRNFGTAKIVTGNGKDAIFGQGGNGGKGGNGTPGGSNERDGGNGGDGGDGIRNRTNGVIETGNGNDEITGVGGLGGAGGLKGAGNTNGNSNDGTAGTNGFGIYNDGLIDMGNGTDTLDASQGGFGGSGTVLMGRGNDEVRGFGTGKFEGGQGNQDRLVFAAGTYEVAAGANGFFNIASGAVTMEVKEFEFINTLAFTGAGSYTVV